MAPKRHLLHHTIRLASQPGKFVTRALRAYAAKRYGGKPSHIVKRLLILDISLFIVAVAVLATGIYLLVKPPAIIDQVKMDATVAPTDVVSGGSSTLVIRYENESDQPLNHARMTIGFPDHFNLQGFDTSLPELSPNTFDLGTIDAGASGSIRLRGVMFGDVGGNQTFTSTLDFTYGKEQRPASKTSTHVFHPVHSTLQMKLNLPATIVSGEDVEGSILYQNTGDVNLPEFSIEPVWPTGFTLLSSDLETTIEGAFEVNGLDAGASGVIHFRGRLPDDTTANFLFKPSFVFGSDRYTQETLQQTVQLLPSELSLSLTGSDNALTPASTITYTIHYKNNGTQALKNVSFTLTGDSPIFATTGVTGAQYQDGHYVVDFPSGSIAPGDTNDLAVTIPLAASIHTNDTSVFENIQATMVGNVTYTLADQTNTPVTVSFGTLALPVTSPIELQAFGRYYSPQGDQLGRGPLPPTVGQETKYWIFLTVKGTTNDLQDVKLDADLGPGVTLSGPESVSVGQSLTYDKSTNSVHWSIGSLGPTLAPGSSVVSVAFEVSITPTASMVGKTPTLISGPVLTAQDAFTGATVTASGATITTNLPDDQQAAGLGTVIAQ